MPKIVKLRRFNPPNLLEEFSAQQINNASGTEFASGISYIYKAAENLRLWVRFASGKPVDLVNYDASNIPSIVYQGTAETSTLDVYSSRMQSAKFDNVTNKYAELTFPGVSGNNNVITFGDGSSNDLPFSISLWFRKLPESDGSEAGDFLFVKGKSDTAVEYYAFYNPVSLVFNLFGSGDINNKQRIVVNGNELDDNNWHHIVFTYDGRGSAGSNVPADGMNIYIDSILQARTSFIDSSDYTYMDGVSEKLFIGANYTTSPRYAADGNMAEFAIWNKELSLEEIRAIYNWTYNASVVKSGYTSLPSRVRLRDMDNRSGCYPTTHRMGDKDRSGQANLFYEDLPIQFGNKIEDDFKIQDDIRVGRVKDYDLSKWVVSKGMTIRREVREVSEGEFERDECAVFSGFGTDTKRFIRTAKKIRNPYFVQFDLLQGPYNKGVNRLNLRKALPTHTLKVQIATDAAFSSPTTIANYAPDPNNIVFYGEPTLNKKPGKTIKLGLGNFPDLGQSYYLRIVQESYDVRVFSWAIRNIEIKYANQNIRYPINVNYKDAAGNRIARKFTSSPHASGSLSSIGSSVKNVSDVVNYFKSFEEPIGPFKEDLVLENASDAFFNEGLDPNVYPGFTTPARSKTKFTLDLNPSEETSIGYLNETTSTESANADGDDTSGVGQPLMCYWNNHIKRWETVGQHVHNNNVNASSLDTLKNLLTSSCVGFGPSVEIGSGGETGSGEDLVIIGANTLHPPERLQLSDKPITQFSFPYGPQYHATASQYILAKDIGITKPFLLEKCSLEYQARFEIPKSSSHAADPDENVNRFTSALFKPTMSPPEFTTADRNFYMITPSFFMLRQFEDNYFDKKPVGFTKFLGATGFINIVNTIPTEYRLAQNPGAPGGVNNFQGVYVGESREMITYGQTRLFITSSDSLPANLIGNNYHSSITPEEMIESGLSADLNLIRTYQFATTGGGLPSGEDDFHIPLTETLTMNFPCRNIAAYGTGLNSRIELSNISTAPGSIAVGKIVQGRAESNIKNSRGLVNGLVAQKQTSTTPLSAPGIPSTPSPEGIDEILGFLPPEGVPTVDTMDVDAPYVILPHDKLILGWQYPISQRHRRFPGGDSSSHRFKMTLFGKSKLHLYGSEVVENKQHHETVNQNLTSCAVYEHVIGDEKVVDQWQVAYRGEMTGSYVSNQAFGFGFIDDNLNSQRWEIAYGSNIVSDDQLDTHNMQSIEHNKGIKRITLPMVSAAGDFEAKIKSFFLGLGANDATATDYTGRIYPWSNAGSLISSNFYPQNMQYVDGNLSLGDLFGQKFVAQSHLNSSYGCIIRSPNVDQGISMGSGLKNGDWLKGQGPKYSFNTRHFGYYTDLLRQGLDSKLEFVPGLTSVQGVDIISLSSPPVRSVFVSGSHKPNSEQKVYKRARLEFLLDDFRFQSSNLNTAMTSSCPFIEDASNAQSAPANRRYDAANRPIITIPV